MKKISISVLVFGLFVTLTVFGCSSVSSMMGKVPGAASLDSSSADFSSLFQEDTQIRLMVATATICFFEGAEKFMDAAGSRESAEKYRQVVENLKANKEDPQAIKNATNSIDDTVAEIQQIKAEKKTLDAEAEKKLALGVVMVGAGGVSDGVAGAKAVKFMSKLKDSLNSAQKNPAQNVKNIAKLKDSMDLMAFLSGSLPAQSKSIASTVDGMVQFAKANNVTISKEDITQKADQMIKG